MRFLLLSAALCGLTYSVCAQSLEGYPSTFNLELDEIINYGDYVLENIGSTTIELAMELDVVCYDPEDGLLVQLDLGFAHWAPRNTDGVFGEGAVNALVTLEPGETWETFFLGQYFVGDMGSEWHIYFYDRNNPEDREQLIVTIDNCDPANAVEELPELAASAAYPNPAQNTVSIDFQTSAFPVQLQVCDVLGNVVKDLTLEQPQGTAQVDVSDLSDGMYFYHLLADGYRSEVTPLVVAH